MVHIAVFIDQNTAQQTGKLEKALEALIIYHYELPFADTSL